jgi:hypothetical protein
MIRFSTSNQVKRHLRSFGHVTGTIRVLSHLPEGKQNRIFWVSVDPDQELRAQACLGHHPQIADLHHHATLADLREAVEFLPASQLRPRR